MVLCTSNDHTKRVTHRGGVFLYVDDFNIVRDFSHRTIKHSKTSHYGIIWKLPRSKGRMWNNDHRTHLKIYAFDVWQKKHARRRNVNIHHACQAYLDETIQYY